MLANHLHIGMRSFVPFQNSALSIIERNIIRLSVLLYECIHKQCIYYVFKQLMAEQSLNKKHPDFKSTAETFVQIYKEKKQSFRHRETFVINRFVWNRSLSPWTSLASEAGKVLHGSGVQNLLRNIFGAKLSFASRNFNRVMKYWLKIVNIPRLVELDNADTFSNLDRTWLDADNLWVIVYPQIMKINAGDHACPGNVGMQRTEWDQVGISHAVKVKFTYGPT